jgi:hypothetical protein
MVGIPKKRSFTNEPAFRPVSDDGCPVSRVVISAGRDLNATAVGYLYTYCPECLILYYFKYYWLDL